MVYRQPRDRFVAEFVGVNNIFSGTIVGFAGGTLRLSSPAGEFSVACTEPDRRLQDSATVLISADRITTSHEGELRDNRVTGRLTGIEFVGTLLTLLLELDNGSEFRI